MKRIIKRNPRKNSKKTYYYILIALAVVLIAIFGILIVRSAVAGLTGRKLTGKRDFVIPEYSGQPFAEVNGNMPFFTDDDLKRDTFEMYSELDDLGRCGTAFANVSRELMPTEKREEIGYIKPTGWKQAKYEGIVDSNPPYLYNRCHLIAYCLTAENANERNLITGTRYLNFNGMLPFEEEVAAYLDENDNHVLYRVTPVFDGRNLVADGVLMEAYSVEDKGRGICFCVYCYNVQPGITINYETGESSEDGTFMKYMISGRNDNDGAF